MITLTCEATDAQRRDALEDLVKRWDTIPPSARGRMLHVVTPLRGPALRTAVDDLRKAMRRADKIRLWPAVQPAEGQVCDEQTRQWLRACRRVDTAMNVLLRDPVNEMGDS
jgi:hypothetical protein